MRVLVENVPVQGTVKAWVEVPAETPAADLQDAIAQALADGNFTEVGFPAVTLDDDALVEVEFTVRELKP